MECDICGQEVENSEHLKRHTERLHPADDRALSMQNRTTSDFIESPESESSELPETAQTRQ